MENYEFISNFIWNFTTVNYFNSIPEVNYWNFPLFSFSLNIAVENFTHIGRPQGLQDDLAATRQAILGISKWRLTESILRLCNAWILKEYHLSSQNIYWKLFWKKKISITLSKIKLTFHKFAGCRRKHNVYNRICFPDRCAFLQWDHQFRRYHDHTR